MLEVLHQVVAPAVVLVVSGGQTSLYHLPEAGVYRLVGRTRDDAAGEAFDKVAKLLGLTYPGGPVVDRLARDGDESSIQFPVARMTHADRAAGPREWRRSMPGEHTTSLARYDSSTSLRQMSPNVDPRARLPNRPGWKLASAEIPVPTNSASCGHTAPSAPDR